MNIDRLIELLKEKGLFQKLSGKRLTTQELPISVYIRLMIASEATKKPLNGCIATALETYCMRNEEKHFNECKLRAAAEDKELEEWVVEAISLRLGD
jgi:hypothetical protein